MSLPGGFAATWWGRGWVEALEEHAALDSDRLPKGRVYARQNHAGPVVVGPGAVSAQVRGSRAMPYTVTVRVRPFTDDEWARLIATIAGRAADAAALLDGELLPEILDDATAADVALLPGPGELAPGCSCPDEAALCPHAAAVCYLVADVLDRDPFELFHLRGRTRAAVLASVREHRRRAAREAGRTAPESADAEEAGPARPAIVAAADAYARPQPPARDLIVFRLPPIPTHVGHPAALVLAPPLGSGLDADTLEHVARDAAARALALLRGDDDGSALTFEQDLARRAADRLGVRRLAAPGAPPRPGALTEADIAATAAIPGSPVSEMARRAGMSPARLVDLALAWRRGGPDLVEVETTTWAPIPDEADLLEALTDAREALETHNATHGIAAPVTADQNRVTSGSIQLRLARSGSWFRFDRDGERWRTTAGPAYYPTALV